VVSEHQAVYPHSDDARGALLSTRLANLEKLDSHP
jgi:hypothetical protein